MAVVAGTKDCQRHTIYDALGSCTRYHMHQPPLIITLSCTKRSWWRPPKPMGLSVGAQVHPWVKLEVGCPGLLKSLKS